MFSRHGGGERVAAGIYWSMDAFEFVTVPKGGGDLPGGPAASYIQTPTPLVLLVAPIFGASLALFLPLSGMITLVYAAFRGRRPAERAVSTRPAADEAGDIVPDAPSRPSAAPKPPEERRDEEPKS